MKARALWLLFGIPLFLLTVSFLIIRLRFPMLWPRPVVVHEDGERTLLGTIFFFEHARGELPEDLVPAAATAGPMPVFGPLASYPLYPGDQARETFTHALVTVPLAAGLLLLPNPRPQPNSAPECSSCRDTIRIAFLCAVMTACQLWGAVATGAGQHAQTRDLLVCAHFFEHTLNYIVVPLHALWYFPLAGREVAS